MLRVSRRPSARVTRAAIGATTVKYDAAARKATLRVDDGFELDQYLFSDSSPLTFDIDLRGIKPPPGEAVPLTMRVFDVDQAGAPGNTECAVEVDNVNVNGTHVGQLSGADSQWSIVSLSIPAGVLTSGVNHVAIDIDVLTGSCWAVQVDWASVEVPFALAQTEAEATNDVSIKRGKSDDVIPDTVWKRTFKADGTLNAPDPDDPIADKISGGWFGWGAREFTYKYTLDGWRERPTFDPKVEYAWEISGGGPDSGGYHEEQGWVDDFTVKLPDKIGKYTLKVTLKVFARRRAAHDRGAHAHRLRHPRQPRRHDDRLRRRRHLDRHPAHGLAGRRDELGLRQEHERRHPRGAQQRRLRRRQQPARLGLRLPEVRPVDAHRERGGPERRLLRVPRRLADPRGVAWHHDELDRLRAGRRLPDVDAQGARQQRLGTVHQRGDRNPRPLAVRQPPYGTFGGKFYDPTFGLVGANTNAGKEGNVFCKLGAGGKCPVLTPPPGEVKVSSAPGSVNGWSLSRYAVTIPRPATRSRTPRSSAGTIVSVTDSGRDSDGNGLFEQLAASLSLNVVTGGEFSVLATLTSAGGDVLATGDLNADTLTNAPTTTVRLPPGRARCRSTSTAARSARPASTVRTR